MYNAFCIKELLTMFKIVMPLGDFQSAHHCYVMELAPGFIYNCAIFLAFDEA